jgi:ectoine hydroxylase-related dioxygenase (phytanoyl-CoA dioxygenase family)
MFLCLEAVEPGGGGTFYVSGSHRVVAAIAPEMRKTRDRVGSARIVKRLKGESRWFAELCSKGEAEPGRVTRFMHDGSELRGVPVRVAEMTGAAGDLLLWHPNLLHAASPANCGNAPRLVISVTITANGAG